MGMRGIIIYPVEPLFAATRAMMDMLTELKETGMCADYFKKMKQPMDYRDFSRSSGSTKSLPMTRSTWP